MTLTNVIHVPSLEAPRCHRARTEGPQIGKARRRFAEAAFLADCAEEAAVGAAARAAWRRHAADVRGSARRTLFRLAA